MPPVAHPPAAWHLPVPAACPYRPRSAARVGARLRGAGVLVSRRHRTSVLGVLEEVGA